METYKVYDSAIEKEHCNNIVKFIKDLNFNSSKINEGEGDVVDEEKRQSQISFLNSKEFIDIFSLYAGFAKEECMWNYNLTSYDTPQVSIYSKNDKYTWHHDMLPDSDGLVRKLSVCITLNDNFKGGDFQIQKFVSPVEKKRFTTVKEMRNAGSIIVFPSFMWHQITPVKYGDRYSIVCWYKGPQFM